MKKLSLLCAMLIGTLASNAQTVIDNFIVGPYVVDYNGKGDVKFRLMDNIDLYEFYELQRDTMVIAPPAEAPMVHAIEISGKVGANRYASKEIGLEGVWKQQIKGNIYFNGGLSVVMSHSELLNTSKRNMLEAGIPLQIELGKLSSGTASLYGSVGVAPTFYSTLENKIWEKDKWVSGNKKKSGFIIAPSIEFGGNIPLGDTMMRIGVYGTYKVNCSTGSFDVYKAEMGRCFLGAKIGIIL